MSKKIKFTKEVSKLNEQVDRFLGENRLGSPSSFANYMPRIAITANEANLGSCLARAYSDALVTAGAVPLLIPITKDIKTLLEALRSCDGLLLTGGADIHPMYLDEEPIKGLGDINPTRDSYELIIIRLAKYLNLPTLGICRGHQILGLAYGSTMYQDLYSQFKGEGAIDHSPKIPKTMPAHKLQTKHYPNRLTEILGIGEKEEIYVNSLHHQAIKEVRYPFEEVAIAPDGVNEAIDAFPEYDIISVQWHPEQMIAGGDERQRKLFDNLVERARLYHRATEFHKRYISVDSHCDTPMFFGKDFDLYNSMGRTKVDIMQMQFGQIDSSIMVAYLPQREVSEEGHQHAKNLTNKLLSKLLNHIDENKDTALHARSPEDILSSKAMGKKAIVTGIENGYAIGTDLSLIKEFRDKYGISYITLCHNGDNAICDSANKSENTHVGLSDFGREVVREMNRLGVMVDLSHTGEATVRDVLEICTKPPLVSHSSVRRLCNHPRNLWDDAIKAIAAKEGVIQVCLYAGFISEDDKNATYLDAVEHIEHIIRLVGIRHVGIGSDFDGDGELIGCRSSLDLKRITMELFRRGYTEEELALLWGGNLLRVMQTCQDGREA